MLSISRRIALHAAAAATCFILALPASQSSAQTYGFAAMPPGSLSHAVASAIAKVVKEKAGLNLLVQPTAGGNIVAPMVGRGEAEIGVVNVMEAHNGFESGQKDTRMIAAVHALRTPFFVRKDAPMRTIADLKGKRVAMGYSAMGDIDTVTRSILATAGLTEADVKPVRVPNVVRSADDFMAGNADMFFFAFGGPKVREADATVGGVRVLEMDPNGMPAARKIMPWSYLTQVAPGPVFTGVEKPMMVYSFDNVLITHAKVPDDFIVKILQVMDSHKSDMVAVSPVLAEFSPAFAYKQYGVPYHPGALKFFKDRNLTPRPIE